MLTVARASRSGLMFTLALVVGVTLFIVACGEAATRSARASGHRRPRSSRRPRGNRSAPRYRCANQGSGTLSEGQGTEAKVCHAYT